MEFFILGVLMMNKLSAYEISQLIKNNYQGICSYSIGNVQRALKLLAAKDYVKFQEKTTGKVVKKVYEITPAGRVRFLEWMHRPLDITQNNNMELGRFLLLGILPPENRKELIRGQIESLNASLRYLHDVQNAITAQRNVMDVRDMWRAHIAEEPEYMNELAQSTGNRDLITLLADTGDFAEFTLEYSIDEIKFQLGWFEKLLANLP